MIPWFIAKEPFSPKAGQRWEKYIAWSGLTQLVEVVSLDGMLCPSLLPEVKDEYWPHIVNEDFMLNFFLNYDFLLAQVEKITEKNILCAVRNPRCHPPRPSVGDFRFLGYDLVDHECSISALTNCGGFPEAFANSELSNVGLLPTFERAVEVQRSLRSLYPEEHHADCDVWAVFRLVC
jgi:hypothetical protein